MAGLCQTNGYIPSQFCSERDSSGGISGFERLNFSGGFHEIDSASPAWVSGVVREGSSFFVLFVSWVVCSDTGSCKKDRLSIKKGQRSRKVEAIQVHHLVPGRDKIVGEFFLAVGCRVDLHQGA